MNLRPLFVVYHLFQAERWEQIYYEQMGAMLLSRLLDHAHLTIGINGDKDIDAPNNCKIVRHVDGFSEKPSLLLARQIAEDHPDALILYLHSKGISHATRNQDDWRMMMQHFLLVNWEKAVDLLEDYDIASVNWRTFPVAHPSGNYWWTRASHLLALDPGYLDSEDRWKQEFWTGSVPCKVANMHESELDHYNEEYPSTKYCPSYFHHYQGDALCLSFSSRAKAIEEGRLSPVAKIDFF